MRVRVTCLAILTIISAGCFNNVKRLDDLGATEVLAFGSIRILRDGEDVTAYSNLIFNEVGRTSWSSARQFETKGGILSVGLLAGDSYVFHIISQKGSFGGTYRYQFPPAAATLHLPQPKRAYYVGDITIDWTPKSRSHEIDAAPLGLVGLAVAAFLPYPGGVMSITVRDNLAEASALFHQRFKTDGELIPALLHVDAAQQSDPKRGP